MKPEAAQNIGADENVSFHEGEDDSLTTQTICSSKVCTYLKLLLYVLTVLSVVVLIVAAIIFCCYHFMTS
jgi:hypothetical protein